MAERSDDAHRHSGPHGSKAIAEQVHAFTCNAQKSLTKKLGTRLRGGITTANIDTISRQDVLYKICDFCSGLMKRQGRPPSALQIRDALTSMVRALPAASSAASLRPVQKQGPELDSLPLETRETADRIITRERFLPGGRVGTEVYRCGVCRTQVYGRDRFCRGCGRELIKTDRKVDAESAADKGVV